MPHLPIRRPKGDVSHISAPTVPEKDCLGTFRSMTQKDGTQGPEQRKVSVTFMTVLVVIGVIFTLLSLVGTLLSAPETWHRFAGFVSDHTSFLSDRQVIYLRNGLLVTGSCIAGFALGRTRRDRKLSKWLAGVASLCIAVGIALAGAAAIEKLDPESGRHIGISNAQVVVKAKEERTSSRGAATSGDTGADAELTKPSGTTEPIQPVASTGSTGSPSGITAKPSTSSGCVCPTSTGFSPAESGGASEGSSTETIEFDGSESESTSESEATSTSESNVESSSESESNATAESRSESESSSEVIVE